MLYLNILLSLIICVLLVVLCLSLLFRQLDTKPHKTLIGVWKKLVKGQNHWQSIRQCFFINFWGGDILWEISQETKIKTCSLQWLTEVGKRGGSLRVGSMLVGTFHPRECTVSWHYHWCMVIIKSKPTFSLFYSKYLQTIHFITAYFLSSLLVCTLLIFACAV